MALTLQQQMRVLVALFVQPVVAGCTAFVLFPALDATASAAGVYQGRASDPVAAAGSIAFGAALMSVFVVVFGALPAIAWLTPRHPITLTSSLIAGALLGNVPAAVILLLAIVNGAASGGLWHPAALVRAAAFGTMIGVSCAAVFWTIAGSPIRRNAAPDSRAGIAGDS